MLNYKLAAKEAAPQDSSGYQMQRCLTESDEAAPWSPLSLIAPSTEHIAVNITIEEDLEEILGSDATQNLPIIAQTPKEKSTEVGIKSGNI